MTKQQLVGLDSITDRLDIRKPTWTQYTHPRFHSRAMENVTKIERKRTATTASLTSVSRTAKAPTLLLRG